MKPYIKNQSFWEFKNQPVILIGGSANDNLFQQLNVSEELIKLKSAGGNYLVCTLSGHEPGDEWPYWRSGIRFNLNKFNTGFWQKLDNFFKLTSENGIFVQLEIWSIQDFLTDWNKNPWNPAINNVLTETNSKLKSGGIYAGNNSRPEFFFSVPNLNNDGLLLQYQKVYIDQLLSVSLKYNHILYCITDKTFPQYSPEWGWFWAQYIRNKATFSGKEIQVTETGYAEPAQSINVKNRLNYFTYAETSNISDLVNDEHWKQLNRGLSVYADNKRPVNCGKVYGGQLGEWTGGPENGVERFWRNLIGGLAATCFNMEPEGLGVSERALKQIKSARILFSEYNFFTSKPDFDFSLLLERDKNEAYLASNQNKNAIVYFPEGGQVVLDFTNFQGEYKLKWLNTEGANWYSESEIKGGRIIELITPYSGSWIALLKK